MFPAWGGGNIYLFALPCLQNSLRHFSCLVNPSCSILSDYPAQNLAVLPILALWGRNRQHLRLTLAKQDPVAVVGFDLAPRCRALSFTISCATTWVGSIGHRRHPWGGWSGTGPCIPCSMRTGIRCRAAPPSAKCVHRWPHLGPISGGNKFQFVINKNSSKNVWQKTVGSSAIYENGLMGEHAAAADGCRRGLSRAFHSVFLCLWINSEGAAYEPGWMVLNHS